MTHPMAAEAERSLASNTLRRAINAVLSGNFSLARNGFHEIATRLATAAAIEAVAEARQEAIRVAVHSRSRTAAREAAQLAVRVALGMQCFGRLPTPAPRGLWSWTNRLADAAYAAGEGIQFLDMALGWIHGKAPTDWSQVRFLLHQAHFDVRRESRDGGAYDRP